jgi:hypothetical protein
LVGAHGLDKAALGCVRIQLLRSSRFLQSRLAWPGTKSGSAFSVPEQSFLMYGPAQVSGASLPMLCGRSRFDICERSHRETDNQ